MTPLTGVGVLILSYAAYAWCKHNCRRPYEFFLLGWATAGLLALSFIDYAIQQCAG